MGKESIKVEREEPAGAGCSLAMNFSYYRDLQISVKNLLSCIAGLLSEVKASFGIASFEFS